LGLDNESMHGACLLSTKLRAYHESLEDQWTIENVNEVPPIHHFLKMRTKASTDTNKNNVRAKIQFKIRMRGNNVEQVQ
jgi:hypothetical protein